MARFDVVIAVDEDDQGFHLDVFVNGNYDPQQAELVGILELARHQQAHGIVFPKSAAFDKVLNDGG